MGKKTAKRRMRAMAGMAIQTSQEMLERRASSEDALSQIRAALGSEGSYDTPTGPPGTGPGTGGIFKEHTLSKKVGIVSGAVPVGKTNIDADALAKRVLGSTEGRIAGRMTAEAEQMLKREGPLWDEMQKSVVGPIIEGSAALMRESSEQLRREFAKGGAARNRARQGMEAFRRQESINQKRQTELWNSSMALNQWARDNARTQLDFNANWASNQAGIRETFHEGMDRAGRFFVETALPTAGNFTQAADAISAQMHAEKRAKAKRIYSLAAGAVAIIAGAAFPAFASIAGGIGGSLISGAAGAGGEAGFEIGSQIGKAYGASRGAPQLLQPSG